MSSWWRQALCADEAGLFDRVDAGVRAAVMEARALCDRCPGSLGCAAESLGRREPVGIWAGMDPADRGEELRRVVIPRLPDLDVMEVFAPEVALADRIDDALAEGKAVTPVFVGPVAAAQDSYRAWRNAFDARLHDPLMDVKAGRMGKAS